MEELGVILSKYIVFMCSSQRISKKIINRFYIYLVCVCVLDFGEVFSKVLGTNSTDDQAHRYSLKGSKGAIASSVHQGKAKD